MVLSLSPRSFKALRWDSYNVSKRAFSVGSIVNSLATPPGIGQVVECYTDADLFLPHSGFVQRLIQEGHALSGHCQIADLIKVSALLWLHGGRAP